MIYQTFVLKVLYFSEWNKYFKLNKNKWLDLFLYEKSSVFTCRARSEQAFYFQTIKAAVINLYKVILQLPGEKVLQLALFQSAIILCVAAQKEHFEFSERHRIRHCHSFSHNHYFI